MNMCLSQPLKLFKINLLLIISYHSKLNSLPIATFYLHLLHHDIRRFPCLYFSKVYFTLTWLMLKILHILQYPHGYRQAACMSVYVATQRLVTWPLQWTIKLDSHHQQKWCLSSVLWEYSCVDCVWEREGENEKWPWQSFSFPSLFLLEGKRRRRWGEEWETDFIWYLLPARGIHPLSSLSLAICLSLWLTVE